VTHGCNSCTESNQWVWGLESPCLLVESFKDGPKETEAEAGLLRQSKIKGKKKSILQMGGWATLRMNAKLEVSDLQF
jgi:hypothetical protein